MYKNEFSVMFSWYEEGDTSPDEMRSVHLHFYNPKIFKRIEQSIEMIVDKWAHIFLTGFDMSAISFPLDENPKRFDWLVENIDNDGDILLELAQGS